MKFSNFLNISLLATCSLIPLSALAQTVPNTAQPGQVEQRLRIEQQRPDVGGAAVITLPDENGNQKPLGHDIKFLLKGLALEHADTFGIPDLRPYYAQYIGKEVTLDILNQVAARITAHYRNAGYILSRAVIPPQTITDGIVKIKIVEGYISNVVVKGDDDSSDLINEYAHKIQSAKPLDTETLERYLLLMQDLPGVTARAVIHPSPSVPGTSELVITVTKKTFDGSTTVDNRGTRYMGPVQVGTTLNANDILGLYDRTQIHGMITPDQTELKYGQIVHEEQLDDEGTRLTLSASHTHTHPGYLISDLDVVGQDNLYSALVFHPFIRSRQSNLFGTAQFDVRSTNSDDIAGKLYHDNLRVFRAGGSYDFMDGLQAVNRVQTIVSKGLNWDASNDGQPHSRSTGRTDFLKANAQISRLQPIADHLGIYVSGTGQWSANTLLSAEQFSLGGPMFGSAYDPSEIVGDSGIAGRAELQFSNSDDTGYVRNGQFYTFYDIGKAWTRNQAVGLKDTQSLASLGAGYRFNVLESMSGSFEIALPMTKTVAANGLQGNAARAFFSLAYRY